MTVQHLQETGVGRTVNGLRKYDGAVGNAAKALVAKWKAMVVDEYSSGEEDDEVYATADNCVDNHNSLKPEGLAENTLNQAQEEMKHVQEESKSETSMEQNVKHSSKLKEQSPKDLEDKNKRHEKSSHSSKHSHNELKSKESRSSKSSSKKDETHKKEYNHSKNEDLEKANDKLMKNNENTSGRRTYDSDSLKRESKRSKLLDSKSNDETSQLFIPEKSSLLKSSEVKMKVENDKDKSNVKQEKEKKSLQEESKSGSSKLKSQDSSTKTKDSSERHKHKKEHTDHKKLDTKKDSNHHSSKEVSELIVASNSKDHAKNKDRDKKREHKEDKNNHGKKKEMKMRLSQEIASNEGIDCNSG